LPALALLLLSLLVLCPTQASALEVLMFGKVGCTWCARFEREVGQRYQSTEEARDAALLRADIRDQRTVGVDLQEPIVYTPTFVVVDDGIEIGRITGYQNEGQFWANLDDILTRARPRRHY
jgi:thioredoxin-related protein